MDKEKLISYKIEEYDKAGISFIKITAEKMYFNVTLADLGASIYEVFFNQKRMTLTPKYPSDFKRNDIYHGKTIGRYNGRIKDGKLVIDGIEYQLDKNQNGNTLHGGKLGLSSRYFEYKIRENDEALEVDFHYQSPHLEAGFPEEVDVYVRYIFLRQFDFPVFYVVYECYSERQTVMKLTNHTYWCLGESSVRTMSLTLKSDQYAEYDENLIYKGMKKADKYPMFENDLIFHIMKNEEFKDGIDNYFQISKKHNKDRPALMIQNYHSGMAVFTNFDGIHLFSDNFEDGVDYFHTKTRKNRALAIEPCLSPSDPGLIDKDHPFHRYMIFEFFCPD